MSMFSNDKYSLSRASLRSEGNASIILWTTLICSLTFRGVATMSLNGMHVYTLFFGDESISTRSESCDRWALRPGSDEHNRFRCHPEMNAGHTGCNRRRQYAPD